MECFHIGDALFHGAPLAIASGRADCARGSETASAPMAEKAAAADLERLCAEARAAAYTAGYAAVEEIAALCMIAGKPRLISRYAESRKDPATVLAELLALRLREDSGITGALGAGDPVSQWVM
jgi:hypothetical protein